MKAQVLTEIIAEVRDLDADDETKQRFIDLVRRIGGRHGIKLVLRSMRVDFAMRLLERKVSRPTIRNRLMATYSMSERQAYRTIDDALKLCQKLHPNGKSFADASAIDAHYRDSNVNP